MPPGDKGEAPYPGQRALRVAFFAMFPDDNMASWTFGRWPVDHAEALGIKARFCPPSSPSLHQRMSGADVRMRTLRMALYWYVLVPLRRVWQLLGVRRYDVVFLQRGLMHPKSAPVLERILAAVGPPIVYHLDDALWILEPEHYEERVRIADLVVTGNAAVREFAERLGTPVSTIEYPVEADRYPIRASSGNGDPVIGWTGSYPEEYLGPVASALAKVCRDSGARVEVVGGPRRPRLGSLDPFVDWRPWDPDRKFVALGAFDIGILPLEDTEEHRGKEPFKLKEYMACALPVVASPIGHVPSVMSDGEQGLFATTEAEWSAALERLIADRDLRGRLGANGRRSIEQRYDARPQMQRLVALLDQVAESRTAGSAAPATDAAD